MNDSAFRLMLEREKLYGPNFNDWFHQLRSVLRVEKKLNILEQPMTFSPAPNAPNEELEAWNAQYDRHKEVACLMIERLNYVLPLAISVGLILNSFLKDFKGFVRNYNMHNMGKKIGELHVMLIEYEKGLLKKVATPQVLAIGGARIQKPNKKLEVAKGKGKRQRQLMKKKKQDGSTGTSGTYRRDEVKTIGNRLRAAVEAIGSFDLVLPNGLVILLDNCHYAPTITRGVVSVSHLVDNGDGIYEIDMHDLCCLAHISKKHIEKLQLDEYFDQCVSSLSGKMTRKPFSHQTERATDLLGLIHTDNEKTIKALRSDRRGEYISQQFKDYLEACRILQHLTPLYTPQHNSVSERRNCTLLDMVRSMMNLTNLPLSFWDYAVESTARKFNMVLTKKVDKTPYELWSERTHRAHDRLCLSVEVEEHSLGDHNEHANYKAALLDPDSYKWLYAIDTKMIYYVCGAVDWKSCKQSTTAMSAIKAEYIAASKAAIEAVWTRRFIYGLGIVPINIKPMEMYYDNSGAIIIANELGVQKDARHYPRRYHYVSRSTWTILTLPWKSIFGSKWKKLEDVFETDFPAIVFNDAVKTNHNISSEPTVSLLDDNQIDFDFVISYDESDEEDYTFTYDKNLFSYKLVSVNDLKSNLDSYDNKIDIETPLVDVSNNSLDDDTKINVSVDSSAFDENIVTNHDMPIKPFTSHDRMEKATCNTNKKNNIESDSFKNDFEWFKHDTPLIDGFDEFCKRWWGKENPQNDSWTAYNPNEEWKKIELEKDDPRQECQEVKGKLVPAFLIRSSSNLTKWFESLGYDKLMEKDGKIKIDKFHVQDFRFWKMQIEDYLYQKKLYEPLAEAKPTGMKAED
ncbi:retrotransposon protein, putative, ty1-copia subclass [Tanacetum coccineum]|uniref:Retrotransposon protein, putative, ty1-copia subclass n=1 Tax=Tanacetum coccineum TaxID=301880 RepID=A0ABQ4Y8C9_9ASTR